MRIILVLVGAFLFFQFGTVWWLAVTGLVLCGLAVAMAEGEIADLNSELARHRSAQAQDRDPQASPTPPDGDAFLRGLRRLGARTRPNARKRDS